ncbi:MAG: hypothetical protein IT226_12150 [Flavobacteriales bacterium]|nr:hypothetical protein [Flavobacteriales bacterium]
MRTPLGVEWLHLRSFAERNCGKNERRRLSDASGMSQGPWKSLRTTYLYGDMTSWKLMNAGL